MLRKSLLLFCTTMMLCTGAVAAPNYPPKTDANVQDVQKMMEPSQVNQLSDIIGKLPEKYKVMIVPSTDGMTTQKYADDLFANYKMGDNEILLVLNMDKQELAVHPGAQYAGKGLTSNVIQDKVDHNFAPYAKQKSYMTGLSSMAQQLSDIIKNGNKPAGDATSGTSSNSGVTLIPTWIYIICGTVLLLLVFLAFGFIQRRKQFKEMDEIEDWMDSIEERTNLLKPDPAFEKQGKSDAVIALAEKIQKELLPAVEFSLLESETLTDRFRFFKAAKRLQQTKDQLAQIDNEISQLQSKMFQSKVALEECERLLDEIKKTNTVVERKLDEARFHHGISFNELREQWTELDKSCQTITLENVDDYTQLLGQLKEMKLQLVNLLKELERYPQLKQEINITLPKEVREIQNGIKEMVSGGYRIESGHFDESISSIEQELNELQATLGKGNLGGVEEKVEQIKQNIDAMYDTMEEVVTKKGMIQHYLMEIPESLNSFYDERDQLQVELEELSLRYRVNEGIIFNYYVKLEETCQFVQDQLFLAKQMDTGNDLEYIQAADVLAEALQEMNHLIEKREEAYQELEELRKGEYEAQETLMVLHAEVVHVEQQIRRQHLPGVPPVLIDMIEEGKHSLLEIEVALNQVPLELQRVNSLVKKAKEFNAKLVHHADSIFYHCSHAEEKIQQTNRYRSHWPDVNELLVEAEKSFRELDFEKSHLLAGKASDLANQYLEGLGRLNFRKKKA